MCFIAFAKAKDNYLKKQIIKTCFTAYSDLIYMTKQSL